MATRKIRRTATAPRGVALLVALSTLAVLTILVMALAFTSGAAQQSRRLEQSQTRAENLARAGFDLSYSILAKFPAPLAEEKTVDLALDDGACRIAASPAKPDDPVYAGNFVRPRPGDVALAVTAKPKGAASAAVYRYLANPGPSQPRRLLYSVEHAAEAK